MKKNFDFFYGFYNEEELKRVWNDESTVFIFDTNILLDLYRYKFETQKKFFEYLDEIKERSWLPYHVGIEFYNNRIKVIRNRQKAIKNVNEVFKNICQIPALNLTSLTDQYRKEEHDEIYSAIDKLRKTLKKIQIDINEAVNLTRDEIRAILEPGQEYEPHLLAEKDKILQKLESIFNTNNIGINLYQNQNDIEALFKEAKSRWDKGVPPGYKDYLEKSNKSFIYQDLIYYKALGDLIIFNEIKHYAVSNENITNIIFISNDTKEDWKHIELFQGEKDLGCRHELRYELQNHANNIKFFEIIGPFQFLDIFSKCQGQELSKAVEDDVRSISIVVPLAEYTQKKNLSNKLIQDVLDTINPSTYEENSKKLNFVDKNQLQEPSVKYSEISNIDVNNLIKNIYSKRKKYLNWKRILTNEDLSFNEQLQLLRDVVYTYHLDYINLKKLRQYYEKMLKNIDEESKSYDNLINLIADTTFRINHLKQEIDEINFKIDSLEEIY